MEYFIDRINLRKDIGRPELNSMVNIEDYDFSLIAGLRRRNIYEAGRKVQTDYTSSANGHISVSKFFEDNFDDNHFLTGITIRIDWLTTPDEDDKVEVAATKTIIVEMNKAEAADHLRKRRQRSISYLQNAAIGTPIETHVNTLLDHYEREVSNFITSGSSKFYDAIETETDATILTYLNIKVEPTISEKNVRKVIYDQIS